MTAIDNMSIARNLLTKVALAETLTEKENFHLQAMYGKVEDKDAPTLLAEAEAMELELKAMEEYFFGLTREYNRLNRKVKVCNVKHTIKGHLRDKAKAGYHGGSKREGWGHYDKWLKPEIMSKDIKRDTLAQMEEMENEEFNFKFSDVVDELTQTQGLYFKSSEVCSMVVYYYHIESFEFLDRWNTRIQDWMEFSLDKLNEIELFNYLDNTYPEMGEMDKKSIVMKAMGQYRLKVLMTACEMWRYCQRNNREYRKEIQDDLNLAYDKLERLVEDIKTVNSDKLFTVTRSFSFIMAQIESLKMKLEKMDEANEKFI